VAKTTFVWITARDGSVHATQPPIIADAQPTLCGRSYGRRDLRVIAPSSTGQIPTGACVACREHILTDALETVSPPEMDHRPSMWP
jgi:hypothetical protein